MMYLGLCPFSCYTYWTGWLPSPLNAAWLLLSCFPTLYWKKTDTTFSSIQLSHSVMSSSLWPHELQHTRPLCPSPTPRVHPNPCPFSQWCHPTISSSVVSFSSYPQPFPASGSYQMSQLFAAGGQSTGISASTSVLRVHHQLSQSTQTHVHLVSDAIQTSHPLSSPSPPTLNLSQHQGPFQWVSPSHQVAKCS